MEPAKSKRGDWSSEKLLDVDWSTDKLLDLQDPKNAADKSKASFMVLFDMLSNQEFFVDSSR